MPVAYFEEKEYEISLYVELANGSPYLWSPGQVLEKRLGIDNAMLTQNSTFWRMVGRMLNIPNGVTLNPLAPNLNIFHRQLPSFHCNVLLQVKRPTYLKRKTLGYTGNSPYYRFSIDADQQIVLDRLARKIGGQAYVGYASPVFWQPAGLYRHIISSSLVQNSVFIPAVRLTNHEHFGYCSPGSSGKAYSDPEDIQNEKSFSEIIEELVNQDNKWKASNESAVSQDLVTKELQDLEENVRSIFTEEKNHDSLFSQTLTWIYDLDSSLDRNTHPAIRSFSNIQLFSNVYRLLWLTVG